MNIQLIEEEAKIYERFMRGVTIDARGCWLFRYVNGQGYGSMRIRTKTTKLHRYSYAVHKGPIPDGLVIDHLCCVKNCCNPDHLEAVPQRVNMERGTIWTELRKKVLPTILPRIREAQRRRIEIQLTQTHCPNGHEYTPENTSYVKKYRRANKSRRCLTCKRLGHARSRQNIIAKKSGSVEA